MLMQLIYSVCSSDEENIPCYAVIMTQLFSQLLLKDGSILKVQSYKLYNNNYMIASTQITNTEILAFTAVLVFQLLSCQVLFINRKDNRNC